MHDQDATYDPLERQLGNLDQLFKEFADQYELAAQSLRSGYVPDPIPNIQLDAARKVFSDTIDAINDAAAPFEIEPMPETPSILMATEYYYRVLEAQAEQERRRKLIEEAHLVIAEIQTLQHKDDPEALDPVQEAIRELTGQLDENNFDDAERLISGEHPLAMLASYAGHRETLSDEEYDTFRENIQNEFGRHVLRDIDRGRVVYLGLDAQKEEMDLLPEEDLDDPEVIDFSVEEDFEALAEATMPPKEDGMEELENVEETSFGSEVEEEDTLWPPLEGDGFGALEDDAPEASLHEGEEEDEEK